MKLVNCLLILIIYIYGRSDTPNFLQTPIFPTLDIGALMVIKILIMVLLFKHVYDSLSSDKIFEEIVFVNILSSVAGVIFSTILYFILHGFLSPVMYIGLSCLWCTFVFVNIIDSLWLINYRIININTSKLCMTVFYSNMIAFIIFQSLLVCNINVLTKDYNINFKANNRIGSIN